MWPLVMHNSMYLLGYCRLTDSKNYTVMAKSVGTPENFPENYLFLTEMYVVTHVLLYTYCIYSLCVYWKKTPQKKQKLFQKISGVPTLDYMTVSALQF